MENKKYFYLDNYKFSIVELEVFSSYKKSNTIDNNFVYLLLVDQDNFIHDYKIKVKKLSIKPKTTKSHEYTKKGDLALIKRMELIDHIGLKHEFGHGTKEIIKINDDEIIKRLNNWLINSDWRRITFQNIEYIITGSNSSGQGNGRGTFYTLYNELKYPFGFLLQCLNISKDINKYYLDVDYQDVWNKYDELVKIDFSQWIKNNELDKWLIKFKMDSYNEKWKQHMDDLKKFIRVKRKEFDILEKKIIKLRENQKKYIECFYDKNDYKTLRNKLYTECFNIINNEIPTEFIYAHIKPVWLIKQEYKQTEHLDENKLNEISDPNNFIPLPPTIHNLYDHYFFYWDDEGKLIKLKNDLNNNEIKNFIKLDKNKVLQSKFYLTEYYEKVIKDKDLS